MTVQLSQEAQSPDHPIISVENLMTRFGLQTIHDGLSLDVRPGEILGVVGGSGALRRGPLFAPGIQLTSALWKDVCPALPRSR